MTPIGTALVVGFIILLIIAIWIDKQANKRFTKEISEKYPPKESFGAFFITEKGELLRYCGSGTLVGYKKWNLADISYINSYKGDVSFHNDKKKVMRGEYLTPSKKKFLKEKAYATFSVGYDNVPDFINFIKKYGPHIQHMVGGEIQE